ncbi:hypothetical protein HDU99_005206, partial [Rhizoclosmatium hyalinum]
TRHLIHRTANPSINFNHGSPSANFYLQLIHDYKDVDSRNEYDIDCNAFYVEMNNRLGEH